MAAAGRGLEDHLSGARTQRGSTVPGPLRVVTVGPARDGRGGIASVQSSLRRTLSDAVVLRHLVSHVDGGAGRRLAVAVQALSTLLRLLAIGRVDVVHVHVSHRGSLVREGAAVLLARAFRTPALVHCHGSRLPDDVAAAPRVVRWAVGALFRSATGVLVLGEAGRELLVTRLGVPADRVQVLSNPVRVPGVVPARERSWPVGVLHLGRLGERKGTYTLLAALAALPEVTRGRLRVVLAGDGDTEEVTSTAVRLGLAGQVTVRGWLDEQARDAELAAARVFVLPSRAEGLPVAMLEAMAWGLAVVVTDVGSISDVATDEVNALLVPVADPDALALVLTRLVAQPQLVDGLGASARRTAAGFSETTWAQQLLAVWQAAAGPAGRGSHRSRTAPIADR